MMTDPIADMLTRIRNANNRRFTSVLMPSSKMKVKIAEVMKNEGYIEGFEVEGEDHSKILKIDLKYKKGQKVIQGLERVSKPGLRNYSGFRGIPRVLGGLGTAIVSTSKGVIAGKKARQLGVGGEVLCYVW
jgi:small subunit ribosomal protein S8